MIRSGTVVFCPALCLGIALAVGCGKKDDTSQTPVNPQQGSNMGPGGMSPQDVLAKLPGGDEFKVGKKAYADQNCVRCHKLGETGGMMGMMPPPGGAGAPPAPPPGPGGPPSGMGGMSGPDLTAVGAKPDRTKEWLADHIRDPKKHKPGSSMPAFLTDKLSDADLDALATYLASRK